MSDRRYWIGAFQHPKEEDKTIWILDSTPVPSNGSGIRHGYYDGLSQAAIAAQEHKGEPIEWKWADDFQSGEGQ